MSGCEVEGAMIVVVVAAVEEEGEGGLLARSRARRGGCDTAVAAAVFERYRRMADKGRDATEAGHKGVVMLWLCIMYSGGGGDVRST